MTTANIIIVYALTGAAADVGTTAVAAGDSTSSIRKIRNGALDE
ncbi:hypothetical protein [Mesorhizobium sp.]|nr:hypothetical protein [Mesorhizobium sp.]